MYVFLCIFVFVFVGVFFYLFISLFVCLSVCFGWLVVVWLFVFHSLPLIVTAKGIRD